MGSVAPHRWDVSPAEARAIQAELAGRVSLADDPALAGPRLVAGVDDAYVRDGNETIAHAAVVLLALPALEPVEIARAEAAVAFPYVPGLLSFREAPAMLAAIARLGNRPDALLVDGQGYAHPRRFGLACHLGVLLDLPTVGCAKSRLVGAFDEPERVFGARTPLLDRGEVVGGAVRTRPRHAPLFVSPGHRVSVDGAVALALACCKGGAFLPEPTRLAHEAVSTATRAARRALADSTDDPGA